MNIIGPLVIIKYTPAEKYTMKIQATKTMTNIGETEHG
jgi:hypothetical protein